MRRGPFRLALAGVAFAALPTVPVAAQGGASDPVIEAARQVSANPTTYRAFAIPTIAVGHAKPSVLAIASGEGYSSACTVRVSTDGGMSWADAASAQPPGHPQCMRSNQGSVAGLQFGPDGTLYFAFAGLKPGQWQSRIFLARSEDLGQSWQTAELPGLGANFDKHLSGSHGMPTVAVDPKNAKRVFVGWQTNYNLWLTPQALPGGSADDFQGRPFVAASLDGGRTFAEPIDAAGDIEAAIVDVHLVVDNNGRVQAFFGEGGFEDGKGPDGHVYVATSSDDGKTYKTVQIASRPGANGMVWMGSLSPAVDRSTGRLYAAFEDMGSHAPKVVVTSSGDGGTTWSEPVAVSKDSPVRQWDWPTMLPWLDVAPNGRVDVAWYAYREDPNYKKGDDKPALQDVYYSSSADSGRSWSPGVRVNDRVIDRTIGIASGETDINGPVGLASTDAMALVAWDDSRNGTPQTQSQDIYFTRVRLAPLGAGGGGGASTSLVWAMFGVAAGLVVSGLTLLVVSRRGRETERQPARA